MDSGCHPQRCNQNCIKCFQKNILKSKNTKALMAYIKWINCKNFKSHSIPPKIGDVSTIEDYDCYCQINLQMILRVIN